MVDRVSDTLIFQKDPDKVPSRFPNYRFSGFADEVSTLRPKVRVKTGVETC